MTQPTVLKHWRKIGKRICVNLNPPCYNNTTHMQWKNEHIIHKHKHKNTNESRHSSSRKNGGKNVRGRNVRTPLHGKQARLAASVRLQLHAPIRSRKNFSPKKQTAATSRSTRMSSLSQSQSQSLGLSLSPFLSLCLSVCARACVCVNAGCLRATNDPLTDGRRCCGCRRRRAIVPYRRTAGTDTTSEHDALGIGMKCEQQAAETDPAGQLKDEQTTWHKPHYATG